MSFVHPPLPTHPADTARPATPALQPPGIPRIPSTVGTTKGLRRLSRSARSTTVNDGRRERPRLRKLSVSRAGTLAVPSRDVRALDQSTRSSRPSTGPSDAVLVLAARAGEAWAQEALFRRHASMANGLAFRLMGRDADVDDLVQDSFVIAFGRLNALEDPQAFAAWLGSIVVRTAGKVIRRRALLERLGLRRRREPVDIDAVAAKVAGPDVAAELRRAYERLDRLPAEQRLAFLLRRVEGMELEEIARAMGISLATAKRRIAAAQQAVEQWADRERP